MASYMILRSFRDLVHRSLLQRRTVRAMLRLLSPNQDVSIGLQEMAIMTAHGLKLHDEDVALALVTLANKAQKMLGVSLLVCIQIKTSTC